MNRQSAAEKAQNRALPPHRVFRSNVIGCVSRNRGSSPRGRIYVFYVLSLRNLFPRKYICTRVRERDFNRRAKSAIGENLRLKTDFYENARTYFLVFFKTRQKVSVLW